MGKTLLGIYIEWKICEYFNNYFFGSKIFIATGGQTPSQAIQKIQSGSLICNGFAVEAGFPGKSRNSKTFTGQASIQAPSAMQISKSTEKKIQELGYDVDEVIMQLQQNLLQGNLTLPEGLKRESFADD